MFHERRIAHLTNEDRSLTSDKDESQKTYPDQSRKVWQPMKLTYTGEAKDVVQFPGNGKLSTQPADPGDPKKPSGLG
jgi:hypothetical protein